MGGSSTQSPTELRTSIHRFIHKGLTCLSAFLFDACREISDLVVDGAPFFHQFGNFLVGVHNCCVVAAAKKLADFR